MIIRELVLHNFGVYAGTNIFSFAGEKPVVLIGGMNGRGKTTFLDAILLALYGPNSFAYHESKYKTYGQYLKSFVNVSDGTFDTYITLEITLDATEKDRYRVIRSWSGNKQRVSEEIKVSRNGVYDQFLTENWAMFIENIIPSGLSNFFFFDGEKIAELAVENTSAQMKESIKTLLGINVIDNLRSDLSRISNRAIKTKNNAEERFEIEKYRKERNDTLTQFVQAENELKNLESQKDDITRKLEKKNQEYAAKGGDIYTQRQQMFMDRANVTARISALNDQLLQDAASELPFLLLPRLLENVYQKAELTHNKRVLSGSVGVMQELVEQFIKERNNSEDRSSISNFMDYVREHTALGEDDSLVSLSDTSLAQLSVLLSSQLMALKNNVKQHRLEISAANEEANKLDSYLSVEIDEKQIGKLFKQIKEYEQQLIELDVLIRRKTEECREKRNQAVLAASAFKKHLDEYLKCEELNDDNSRIIKYSNIAESILEEYTIRLQKNKVDRVASTMTACYHKLANKKNLIAKIVMDPVTLDLQYYDYDQNIINKASLSAGEKQLMVISLLWALALCSKRKLPVIIDTPLSRLDSAHRSSLIQTYFPNASEQTIILSTDSEIDQAYYAEMKHTIGDEYTLVYDDLTKSTSVVRGYFPGVVQ